MTYRDDHAAAIARIDALEAKVSSLQEENARLRAENMALRDRPEPAEPAAPAGDGVVTRGLKLVASAGIAVGVLAGLFGIYSAFATCGSFPGIPGSEVRGRLDAAGPALGGDWALDPGRCSSGQHMHFYGVDIVDRVDPIKILRLLEDPVQGRIVKMNIPGTDRARFIDKASCKVWDWQLQPTNTTVNDIRLIDGHIELDCTFAEGGTFRGRIDFEGCQ
jgi:hypothetical protein